MAWLFSSLRTASVSLLFVAFAVGSASPEANPEPGPLPKAKPYGVYTDNTAYSNIAAASNYGAGAAHLVYAPAFGHQHYEDVNFSPNYGMIHSAQGQGFINPWQYPYLPIPQVYGYYPLRTGYSTYGYSYIPSFFSPRSFGHGYHGYGQPSYSIVSPYQYLGQNF